MVVMFMSSVMVVMMLMVMVVMLMSLMMVATLMLLAGGDNLVCQMGGNDPGQGWSLQVISHHTHYSDMHYSGSMFLPAFCMYVLVSLDSNEYEVLFRICYYFNY